MTASTRHALPRLATLAAALAATALLCACVVEEMPAPRYYVQAPPPRPVPAYPPVVPAAVPVAEPGVSIYVDPPIDQPEPIAVQWAPPPMRVEMPPPPPYPDAVWIGGYWAWSGGWFWAAGRWAPPPRPRYFWVQPYYEHRGDIVVFVPGFWCAPERHFVPPPPGLSLTIALAAPGARFGHPPMGPQGVFVPPPPGSRPGLIVPAPIGTPPAVVVSAPPVVNPGMRVRGNVDFGSHNVSNMTVEAPPNATANGQAFRNSVPAGHAPMPLPLPAGQPVRNDRGAGARPYPQQPAVQAQPAAPQNPALQGPQRATQRPQPEFDAPPRQPGQGYGQPPQGQPQAANGKPARQEKDERRRAERERKDDREKKDGERDR